MIFAKTAFFGGFYRARKQLFIPQNGPAHNAQMYSTELDPHPDISKLDTELVTNPARSARFIQFRDNRDRLKFSMPRGYGAHESTPLSANGGAICHIFHIRWKKYELIPQKGFFLVF